MTQPPRDTKQGLLSGAGKPGFSHLELLDDQLLVLDVTSQGSPHLLGQKPAEPHLLRFPKESLVAVALLCFARLPCQPAGSQAVAQAGAGSSGHVSPAGLASLQQTWKPTHTETQNLAKDGETPVRTSNNPEVFFHDREVL